MGWSEWKQSPLLSIEVPPSRMATIFGDIHAISDHWGPGAPDGIPFTPAPFANRLDNLDLDSSRRVTGGAQAGYSFSNVINNVTPHDGALGESTNEITGGVTEALLEYDGTNLIRRYTEALIYQDDSFTQWAATNADFLGWGTADFSTTAGIYRPAAALTTRGSGGPRSGLAMPRLAILDEDTYGHLLTGPDWAYVNFLEFNTGAELPLIGAPAGGPWPTITVDTTSLGRSHVLLLLAQMLPPGWGTSPWFYPAGDETFDENVHFALEGPMSLIFRPPNYRRWDSDGGPLVRNRVFDLEDQVVTVRLYDDANFVAVTDSITYAHLDGSAVDFFKMPRDAGARASLIRIQVMFNAQANSHRRDVNWRRAD